VLEVTNLLKNKINKNGTNSKAVSQKLENSMTAELF